MSTFSRGRVALVSSREAGVPAASRPAVLRVTRTDRRGGRAVVALLAVLLLAGGGGGAAAWYGKLLPVDDHRVYRRTRTFCEALKAGDASMLDGLLPRRTEVEKAQAPAAAGAMISFVRMAGGVERYEIGAVAIDGDRAQAKVTLVAGKRGPDTSDLHWQRIDGEWYLDLARMKSGKAKKGTRPSG